jgi:hypothetical protein
VKLNEQQRACTAKPPLTTFRDLPGLVTSVDRPQSSLEPRSVSDVSSEDRSNGCSHETGGSNTQANMEEPPAQGDETNMEAPEEWESLAGIDEQIAQGRLGSQERFAVAETDGIDLSNQSWLNMLSNEPFDFVVTPRSPSPTVTPALPSSAAIYATEDRI